MSNEKKLTSLIRISFFLHRFLSLSEKHFSKRYNKLQISFLILSGFEIKISFLDFDNLFILTHFQTSLAKTKLKH